MPDIKTYLKNIAGSLKSHSGLFFRFLKFLFPYRRRWLFIVTLSAMESLFSLVNPYIMKLIIDKAIGRGNIKALVVLISVGSFIFVLGGLSGGLSHLFKEYISVRINFDLNKKVLQHFEKISFTYFQNKSTATHLYKLGYDIDRVVDFITDIPVRAVSIFPKVVLVFGIVFYLNWKIAVMSLGLTPFFYLPTIYFAGKRRRAWREWIEHFEGIFRKLQEFFSHIQLTRVFGRDKNDIRDYLRSLIANIRIKIRSVKLGVASNFVISSIGRVILGIIIFYGSYQVIEKRMTLGSLTAIIVYLGQLVVLQSSLSYFFQTIALGLVSCRRVAEVLDEKPELIEGKRQGKVALKKGEIVFRDVSFGYNPSEVILDKVNFNIKSGSFIVLTGPSGCGKTTLLNLILKLYKPVSGNIFIDGYNINDIDSCFLRKQIGAALQEPFLLNDTIENNIKYAREDARPEEIIEAAKLCKVDEFVRGFPKGYRTIIGENGCKLSEGQKQKIALARALIKKTRILLLDEAFSSMDYDSEKKIIKNIREKFKDTTLIIVSHRLSTSDRAEKIFSLSEGKLQIRPGQRLLQRDKE